MGDITLTFGEESTAENITAKGGTSLNLNTAPMENDSLSISSLSEAEQQSVKDFVKQININDNNAVVTYGSSAQKKIADFSDTVLKNVRSKDLGEAGELLSGLVVEIQNFDSIGEEKKGIFALISNAKKTVDKMVASYSKVEVNVEKITESLENHRRQLLKDIAIYDSMFENNYNYFKELNMYIIAGKEKLREIEEVTIPQLRAKAETSNDEIDAQKLNDVLNAQNRFEKKIHDLLLSRTISLQMAPQIRLVQNNNSQLVDKIQSTIVNSIPLWKNQIVIALGLAHSKQALETQKQVTSMTNELLKKNSEMLKTGSIEIARESEKGIVEIETVQKTNKDLIETIKTVLEIQQKGSEARHAAEIELGKIEDELKQALIDTKRK
jgi:uncharacterized protein YaaN involved in tellurite resistance